MRKMSSMVSKSLMTLALTIGFVAIMGIASAQQNGGWDRDAGIAIGAGLAIGLAGLATGIAMKDIGSAAVGAVAENPANLGRAIVFIAIPETIVIFGLLIAFTLAGAIGPG
jgi:V/A-type H+/Na+-transporting ATPase subunit K